MARKRTQAENRQIYQRRKARAIEEGFSSPSARQRASGASDDYYANLAFGKGSIAQQWRGLTAGRSALNPNDRAQASSFARMFNKALHTKSPIERRKITTQWVASLNLSPMEADWLVFQLSGSP